MKKLLPLLFLLAGCAGAPTAPSPGPEANLKEGEASFSRGHYEDAIASFKKARDAYGNPELTAAAEIRIADAHFENKAYIEAAAAYEDFRKLHPTHPKAPFALYRSALSQFNQIEGIDRDQTPARNAAMSLENFLRLYPNSEFVPQAKAKLQETYDLLVKYENYVASFYIRKEKYKAAAARMEQALAKFPGVPSTEESLFLLGTASLKAGDREKGKQALQKLLTQYPKSGHLHEAMTLLNTP